MTTDRLSLEVSAELDRIDRAVRQLDTEDRIICANVLMLAIEAFRNDDSDTFVACMSTLSAVADIVERINEAESN